MTAAAVWFPRIELVPDGVDDSKKVPEKRRDALAAVIRLTAIVSVGHATVEEIDRLGIHVASRKAMARAWIMLNAPSDALVIVDGDAVPEGMSAHAVALKGADASCPSVAAASIVAKVDRDQAMRVLAGEDDPYRWRANKGYGTADHMAALERHGPTPYHRRSFAPVARCIERKSR